MRTGTTLPLRSQTARDELVEQYLPLVRYVVARLPVTMPSSLDRDDFFSVGVMGLVHAASAYDPNRGASFKTFAFTAIRGAILDEIRKHDPVPRSRRDRLRKMERESTAMTATLQREPTLEELAERLGEAVTDLEQDLLAQHTSRTLSMDDGADEGHTLATRIFGESCNPGERAERTELVEALTKAISELPETDRHVIVLYHYEDLYLKEIGEILGVSESRVSQILTRATERLRFKMRHCAVDPRT
ncbi:MAG: FliA/WhiG family RNA polymerase sigma factor [Planctomycetes bacterium]|nr:FliA/WhiG family RNA polymerase sigma factor [Planctomycetota bacterium]MCB9872000.1 FliA/WhiG family RNA polymerase sigma factor [Planctomycetota bacterium]MCB9888405.1 FliA/WhiG family RNA polymerase sigma factor [Planctomycetota bacterium]